jgi:hypothetical protein
MDIHSAPYLDGPRSCISTLTFSTPFVLASAILARTFGSAQLKRDWIEDPRVWELEKRVQSRHDVALSLKAMTADIPVGAALRRIRRRDAAGFAWHAAGSAFGKFGRWVRPDTLRLIAGLTAAAGDTRPLNLSESTKPLGARVEMRLRNGRRLSQSVLIPRGFAGADTGAAGAATTRDLMREKFIDAAGDVIGFERATRAARTIEQVETLSPDDVARFFQGACLPSPELILTAVPG